MPTSLGENLNTLQGEPQLVRALEVTFPVVRTVVGPTWTSVPTISTSEQTMTVTGVDLGDFVYVNKPTHQTGLGIAGCRVSAKNTVAVTWMNPTAAGITPTAAETYRVLHARATV